MTSYLVEAFAPGSTEVAAVEARARDAAIELSRAGARIRYLRSILIREDETWFHMFEAESIDTVRTAATLARLGAHRIVEAEP